MTNEEIVALIQAGERERMLELWEQTERFVSLKANSMDRKLEGRFGVTAEDLMQAGYLALVRAAETYSPDAGSSFINWLVFFLQQEFAKCGGWRTTKRGNDPLQNAVSLDTPLGNDGEDDATLLDLQADPAGEQPFTDTEEEIWRAQLRVALDAALDQIPARQAQVIRYRYFQEYTQEQIANAIGTSKSRIGQLEELAISSLQASAVSDPLEAFIERRTPYHIHVGIEEFRRTQTSAVEKIVLIREQLRERHHPNSTRGVHHDHKGTPGSISSLAE